MKILRLFSGGGDLGRSDLNAAGSLIDLDAEELARRGVAERNGLLARWLAEVVGESPEIVVADLPRLFGLSMGRPRLLGRVNDAFRDREGDAAAAIGTLLEAEVRAGAAAIDADASIAHRQYLGHLYGGVSIDKAAHVAIRAQRLRAFGGRLLHSAIQSAVHGELDGLTSLAPVGPIRLQTESLIKTLRRIPVDVVHPNPHARTDEQTLRNRGAELMLDADAEPRFIGTYGVHGQSEPHFVLGFEHPARDPRELQRIARQTPDWLGELGPVRIPVLILLLDGPRVRRAQRIAAATRTPDLLGGVGDALAFVAGPDLNVPLVDVLASS